MLKTIQNFKQLLSGIDMTQGKPWKKLILFTLPLLIGNLFQQLYSTADAIILGRFVGDNALAAVGSSMPIFFLVFVIMMGISMGIGVMVAQYFGAKKREELSRTIGAAITITALLGVVMMAIGPFVTRPILVLLRTPENILDDSVMYMNVLILGILGLAYFNILSGILRGLGDAFSPLLYLMFASILNVFLNLFLIPEAGAWTLFGICMPGAGFGVWGAAIGTVFAQGLTAILCLRRLMKMRHVFDLKITYLVPQKKYVKQILKLGIPTAISQAVFAIAMMIVQPLINDFGESLVATNIIVMRIDGFVMMPIFSFGNAITVFAGQNMGAGKLDRLSKGMKQCILMSLGTATVLVTVILLLGPYIARAFTDTPEVIAMSQTALRILAVGYLGMSVNMVLWGMIRGAGDAMTPLWGAIINTALVRVPVAYLMVHFMGRPEAIFYSLMIAWLSNLCLGILAFRFGNWRNKGIIKQGNSPPRADDFEEDASMNIFNVISARYSHKEKFLPEAVPLADLEKIAQAGLDAPSGANRQTVRLIILPDKESIAPLSAVAAHGGIESAAAAIAVLTDGSLSPADAVPLESSGFAAFRKQSGLADVNLSVCDTSQRKIDLLSTEQRGLADPSEAGDRGQRSLIFEKEDYSAAVQNMLLAATALGYSSLWLDSPYFSEENQKRAKEVLGAPDTFHLWAVLPIGKPDGEGTRREKLPFKQRVFYRKFGTTNV